MGVREVLDEGRCRADAADSTATGTGFLLPIAVSLDFLSGDFSILSTFSTFSGFLSQGSLCGDGADGEPLMRTLETVVPENCWSRDVVDTRGAGVNSSSIPTTGRGP